MPLVDTRNMKTLKKKQRTIIGPAQGFLIVTQWSISLASSYCVTVKLFDICVNYFNIFLQVSIVMRIWNSHRLRNLPEV